MDKTFAYTYKYEAALKLFPDYVEVTWYEDGESRAQISLIEVLNFYEQ